MMHSRHWLQMTALIVVVRIGHLTVDYCSRSAEARAFPVVDISL